jgi:hypothetical protein
MSRKINTLAKIAIALQAALLTTMAGNITPAKAVVLNFSFTTDDEREGSFNLDTSVVDTNSSNVSGFYPQAIQDFTFDGSTLTPDNLLTSELTFDENLTPFAALNDENTQSTTVFILPNNSSNFSFNDSEGQLINQLSSDPSVYTNSFINGSIFVPQIGDFREVTSLNAVTSLNEVPEPTTIVGSLVALGMGWQIKRKMKKGNLSF